LQNQFVSFKVSDFANEDEEDAAHATTTTTSKTRSRSFVDELQQNQPEPSANPGGGNTTTTNWSNRLSNLTWLPSFNHDDLIKNKCLFPFLFSLLLVNTLKIKKLVVTSNFKLFLPNVRLLMIQHI
jgi:hypothetical protein